MKSKLGATLVLVLSLVMISTAALAHHGSQGYDNTRRITLKGTVREFLWANPHSELFVDVKDEKGAISNWVLELNSPGNLVHIDSGWYKNVMKPGDQITATFNPGKEGRLIGICTDVVLASGQKLHSNQGCVNQTPAGQ